MNSAYDAGRTFGLIVGSLACAGITIFALVAIVVAAIKRTKGWIVTAIIVVMLGFGSLVVVGVLAAKQIAKSAGLKNQRQTITSEDGWIRLKVPGNWTHQPKLNDTATVKYANPFAEQYLMVFSDPRTDFRGTLEEFARKTTTRMKDNLEGGQLGSFEPLTIHGFPAMRTRIEGATGSIQVVYQHTSIETPDGFHQIIQWTLPSREAAAFPIFEEVAATFELAKAPAAATPSAAAPSSPSAPRLKVPSSPRPEPSGERL